MVEAMRGGRWWLLGFLLLCSLCLPPSRAAAGEIIERGGRGGRLLLGFTETRGNASFQCSPSGPCLPCLYSEKNNEKYRCSETGYRVPLKCVEAVEASKKENKSKTQRRLTAHLTAIRKVKWRKLLDDSTTEGGKQSYITYRSCLPAEGEEKLSVLGFELIMVVLLLVSAPVVYLRQKRTTVMSGVGAVRIPSNSPRF